MTLLCIRWCEAIIITRRHVVGIHNANKYRRVKMRKSDENSYDKGYHQIVYLDWRIIPHTTFCKQYGVSKHGGLCYCSQNDSQCHPMYCTFTSELDMGPFC